MGEILHQLHLLHYQKKITFPRTGVFALQEGRQKIPVVFTP